MTTTSWIEVANLITISVSSARDARIHELEHEDLEFSKRYLDGGFKPHQIEGLRWLSAMYDCGCSCILGDEMGMGKTAQAIALIMRNIYKGFSEPILIVAPLAVIRGWEKEIQQWSQIAQEYAELFIYHPSSKKKEDIAASMLNTWRRELRNVIVLTTPGMLVTNYDVINAHGGRWSLVVVDEAHNAKNSSSLFSKSLQSLDTNSYLLLTGTIIHNNIEEELLHLLQGFIIPGVATEAFAPAGMILHEKGGLFVAVDRPTAALEAMGRILYCFMLRRLIQDTPGVRMPPKISCTVYLSQTPLQKKLYADATQAGAKDLCDKHPYLVLSKDVEEKPHSLPPTLSIEDVAFIQTAVENSNKMKFLMHILPILQQEKHKSLIFSNSLGVLHLLGICLKTLGFSIDLITGEVGDVNERQQRLDRFNSSEHPNIMLLSTKAMSQGVQLTGADTVIFFDHHDNPQNDNQAEARVYRITQGKPVLVLRLVTLDTQEASAMDSWVKRKREMQEWLEIVHIKGYILAKKPEQDTLKLNDEAVLRKLLLERSTPGQWQGLY